MKKIVILILYIFFVCGIFAENFNKNLTVKTTNFDIQGSKAENYTYTPWGKEESPFHISMAIDIPTAITAVTLFSVGFCLKPSYPDFSVIGNSNPIYEINSFDRLLMKPYSKALDITSSVFTGITFLAPAILFLTDSSDYLVWLVMYAETMLITQGIKEITKKNIYRLRPFMYFNDVPMEEVKKGDWCDSFFSGHTSLAFAAAVFTSVTFSQYFPKSPWNALVISGSTVFAGSVMLLRIFSGCHFLTDTLTGVAFGSLVGFGVPFLHKLNPKLQKDIYAKTNGKIQDFNVNLLSGGICFSFKF
ncbi:MAG: phosphatase PAP2 family protein [Treponemataceae bacterium]